MLASFRLPCTSHLSFRPPQDNAVSHMRPSLPRAGSPSYWAPRLAMPPSGPEFCTGNSMSIARPIMFTITAFGDILPLRAPCQGLHTPGIHEPISLPPPYTSIQEGENTLGIAQLRACQGRSYPGPIKLTPKIPVQTVRCNGLHPGFDPGDQTFI